jgi:hypothetical protein
MVVEQVHSSLLEHFLNTFTLALFCYITVLHKYPNVEWNKSGVG